MVVLYSLASMGVVPPVTLPFSVPSPLTMTQPAPPGVVVKVKPVKLDASRICALVLPVAPAPPAEIDCPVVWVSQKLLVTVPTLRPSKPPVSVTPVTEPAAQLVFTTP